MRVIVVGGGIAGLSAAIALRRTGNEAVVLERAPRVDPVGAGITLFGNAMRALDRLGVAEAVAARGAAATRSAILTSEGRELTRVLSDLLEGTIALHRADLQAELEPQAAICASAWRSPRSSSARTESSPEAPTAARSEAISWSAPTA